MDWPLPLWKVLGEELDQFGPRTPLSDPCAKVEPLKDTKYVPAYPIYEYRSQDIRDADLLRCQLDLRMPDFLRLVAKRPKVSTAHAVDDDALLKAELANMWPDERLLNLLLVKKDLHEAFAALAEARWIKEQDPEHLPAEQVKELNRYLLDVAFEGSVQPIDETMLSSVVARLHDRDLSALCFSGGGIRSATFCLGVVQGLARKGLLDKFHYLSTVSGGGYLGSWLAAWTYWSKGGLPEVAAQLAQPNDSKLEPEPDPVFYLRNFSNYLTPRTGLMSADTWTLIGIFLRNLLLHWSVIAPAAIAVLLIPYLLFTWMRYTIDWHYPLPHQIFGLASIDAGTVCLGIAVIAMAVAILYESMARPSNLKLLQERVSNWPPWRGQRRFFILFLTPLVLSSFMFSVYYFHRTGSEIGLLPFVLFGAFAGVLGWLLIASVLGRKLYPTIGSLLWSLIKLGISSLLGGLMLGLILTSKAVAQPLTQFPTLYFCLMPPIILSVFLLAATIFIGLVSFTTTDEDREYWARVGAWALIATLGWLVFGAIALFGPRLLLMKAAPVSISTGALSSIVAGYFGWSSKSEARTENRAGTSSSTLLSVGLPLLGALALVFILCALALLSFWLVQILTAIVVACRPNLGPTLQPLVFSPTGDAPTLDSILLAGAFSGWMVFATLVLVRVLLFFTSRCIDVNKYSLHAMYRNRLIRAYLGASRPKGQRQPNPFTGFDPDDNIEMYKLWKKPERKLMPVINIALNLVAPISDKLAWQERKAESFVVTPMHVGNFLTGYRSTQDYAAINTSQTLWGKPKSDGPDKPLSLGTATAISGAAVSPNMGYNSSPIVAMLLSILNVRLGWWLGNPGAAGNQTYRLAQPGSGVRYFADEAFGRTSAELPFVYLSDGGHFENLGLYEMILRRCHTILVIDADEDARSTFENLGNAIRKVRIDFGISIDFPSFPNFAKRNEGGQTTAYCAVGTIKYSDKDLNAKDGSLIYVKPTIIGNEPTDILNYEKRCGAFPHESTGDQWFSESQFESYRALGMHEIETIIDGALTEKPDTEPYELASWILKGRPLPNF